MAGFAARVRARLLADGAAFRGECEEPDTESFIGRVPASLAVPSPLPPATADDFGRVDRAERLATPEAWQEWLGEYTGNEAWAGERLVAENHFMARAAVGDVTGGYVKTDKLRDGLVVWDKL